MKLDQSIVDLMELAEITEVPEPVTPFTKESLGALTEFGVRQDLIDELDLLNAQCGMPITRRGVDLLADLPNEELLFVLPQIFETQEKEDEQRRPSNRFLGALSDLIFRN